MSHKSRAKYWVLRWRGKPQIYVAGCLPCYNKLTRRRSKASRFKLRRDALLAVLYWQFTSFDPVAVR